MEAKLSKQELLKELHRLLSSAEGVVTLLSGSLMISDFDDPDLAIEEALKTFNSNRSYFDRLIERNRKVRL